MLQTMLLLSFIYYQSSSYFKCFPHKLKFVCCLLKIYTQGNHVIGHTGTGQPDNTDYNMKSTESTRESLQTN